MHTARSFALLFLVVTLSPPVTAMDCLEYESYPHWISQLDTRVWTADIIVRDNLAYLADRTGGVAIIDIRHPLEPELVGELVGSIQIGWSASADALALSGDHLFVADGSHRLIHVLNVADPTEPYLVTQVDTGEFPKNLAIFGNTLYAAVQNTGVEIFDITDPTAPLPIGLQSAPFNNNVKVFDNLLFVATMDQGLLIFDLDNPAVPSFQSLVPALDEGETYDIAVLDHLAYVTGSFGTMIVDIADPTEATMVGSISETALSITIDGHQAYLPFAGIGVLDLTDPLNPVPVTHLPQPSMSLFAIIRKVVVRDGLAYTAADDAGLMIANVVKPMAPPSIPTMVLPQAAERIRSWDHYALVADQSAGLLVVDLADPMNPDLASTLDTENALAVITHGNLAYLADGGDGLKVIDLTDPTDPLLIGHLDTYSRVASGLALEDGLIYLATGLSGLKIIDVSDPAAPFTRGEIATTDRAQDVCLNGDLAYVADNLGGLQVVDISHPEAPWILDVVDLPGRQQSLLLDGQTLYIGGIITGLRAFDVSTPDLPELVGWLPIEAQDLALAGDQLLAAGSDGVSMIDCSDPAALATVGFLPMMGDGAAVMIAEDFILASGNTMQLAPRPCPVVTGIEEGLPSPAIWASLSGHPNPFNPRLEITFELSTPQAVRLEIYDLAGRRVAQLASDLHAAEIHRASWNGRDQQGRDLPSGGYFVVLRGEHDLISRQVTLVR